MIQIEDLLLDYKNIKNPLVDKKEVAEVLNREFNLNIKEDQVLFRKNVVILKINPTQKSVVYMKKNDVLEKIKNIVPCRFINTIQF